MKWQRVTLVAPTSRGDSVIGIGRKGVFSLHSRLVRKYSLGGAKYVNLYVDNPASPTAIALEFPMVPDSASYPLHALERDGGKSSHYRQFSALSFINYYALQEFLGNYYEPSKSGEYLVISLNAPVPVPERVEKVSRVRFSPEHR